MDKFIVLLYGEDGQGMTEYGLVLSAIAFAVLGILITYKGHIKEVYQMIATALSNTH